MIRSIKHFEAVIGYPKKDIVKALKSIDQYYYHFEQIKKSGKIRHLYPSERLLKDIQNRLVSRVFSNVIFPHFITGSAKKRSNVLNAKIHSGKKYHFKTDLLSYFDFVTNNYVYTALCSLGLSADIASLVTKLTTYKGHLPQGAPTSPFLANLIGLPMDNEILKICKDNNITYTRYVDDLNLSSEIDFKELVADILTTITTFGFYYNHKKTVYKVGNIEITGVISCYNGIIPNCELIQRSQKIDDSKVKTGLEGCIRYIEKINQISLCSSYKKKYPTLTFPKLLRINN